MREIKNKKSLIILAVTLGFYIVMALYYGPVLASDSKGYIEMISAREPVYPLFLLILRLIFGGLYLNAAVFIQSVLMAVAIWHITVSLDKIFNPGIFKIILILCSFAGVAAVCILFTARAVPYTNIILTEGLAMPLWLFFMDLLIMGVYEKKQRYLYMALLLSALMMDIRKQMAIGFIVTCVIVFLAQISYKVSFKELIKKLLVIFVATVLAVILAVLGTRIYNYVLRGEFAQNTRDMNLVLTTSLYVCDREDAELIEEEAVKELYLKVWDSLEVNECTFAFAPKGLAGLQSHYSDSFDKITIETTADLFIEDAINRGFKEGIEAEQEADRTSGVIVKSLFMNNLGKYVLVYVSSLSEGFINTVAKRHPVLDWYALLVYAVYIGMIIYNALRYKKTGDKLHGDKLLLGLMILVAIGVNVGVTGALIFCQTRYMLYNMALFYVGLIIMMPRRKM